MTIMEAELPTQLDNSVTFLDFDPPAADELVEIYHRVMEMTPQERRPNYLEQDIHRIISAGQGTEALEFENALARAVILHRDRLPRLPIDDFVQVVLNVKTETIKKSEVLELMPTANMGAVGGLDELKAWVDKRRHAFKPEARAFGVDKPRGMLLVGPPGCLHGATIVHYKRGTRNSSRPIRLDQFYRKFNRLPASTRPWDNQDTYLHSFNPQTGQVFYNRVASVMEAGIRPTVRVRTNTHGEVILTADHPILLADGAFLPAGELRVGQSILCKGNMHPCAAERARKVVRERVTIEGLKYYSSGWKKRVTDHRVGAVYEYKKQHRARLVVEAQMNNMTFGQYVGRLKLDPQAINLKTIDKGYEVHHIDEDPTNDTLSNLLVILKPDHTKLHCDETRFQVSYTRIATVETIEPFGRVMTHDILMDLPGSNFAVNSGIIVHDMNRS